jgi:UDP-N-acetylglucosamine 2-epimerase (non-hydrolysing)
MIIVLNVIGTRPEAIKMAPVVQALRRSQETVRTIVCVTGQHREMLDQVLGLFEIKPDYDLNLMEPDQSLSLLTSRLFAGLDSVVLETKPDWILAQGDTSTVLVAALVAFYHKIKFGHVEAGLRTGNKYRPFPEEINRRVADIVADALFVPTERARQALLHEGVRKQDIHLTGNTVVDALLDISGRDYNWSVGPLSSLFRKPFVLITAHRRESFGLSFRHLCEAIRDLAIKYEPESYQFVYPVHLNPNVRKPVYEILGGLSNVQLIEPLDYFSLVHLMKRSLIILTDSGGIQEEAPSLRVPVLVMREETERPEGVEAGVARLVGTDRHRIVAEASRLLRNPEERAAMVSAENPYGDGKAAERIVRVILDYKQ